jgi:tetratricopeptide (TPR) repeat protein
MMSADTVPDFDKLWDYENPDQTEGKFRELVPAAEQSGDCSYYVQLLTQIARAEGLQSKFEDAHTTLNKAESLLTEDMVTARLRYLLERGRVFNSSQQPDKARPLFLEAWNSGVANGEDYYAVDAAHMMQIVEPPEKQLEWAEKAMVLAEKSKQERAKKWLGPLYNNTGWTYFDLGQYDKALELFEKSLAWRTQQNDEDGIRIATWTIARAYRQIGRIQEAYDMQKTLEKERKEQGLGEGGYVCEELGELLLLMDRAEEARPYFQRAYELLSQDQWLVDNEAERLERLRQLGSTAQKGE